MSDLDSAWRYLSPGGMIFPSLGTGLSGSIILERSDMNFAGRKTSWPGSIFMFFSDRIGLWIKYVICYVTINHAIMKEAPNKVANYWPLLLSVGWFQILKTHLRIILSWSIFAVYQILTITCRSYFRRFSISAFSDLSETFPPRSAFIIRKTVRFIAL